MSQIQTWLAVLCVLALAATHHACAQTRERQPQRSFLIAAPTAQQVAPNPCTCGDPVRMCTWAAGGPLAGAVSESERQSTTSDFACRAIPNLIALDLKNSSSQAVTVTISRHYCSFDIPPVLQPTPANAPGADAFSVIVGPSSSTPSAIGCTSWNNGLVDSPAFQQYQVGYQALVTPYVPPTDQTQGGGSSEGGDGRGPRTTITQLCNFDRPKFASCASPNAPLPIGTYHVYQTIGGIFGPRRPVCLGIKSDGGFERQACEFDSGSANYYNQRLYFGPSDLPGCYEIHERSASGVVLLANPHRDADAVVDFFGWGKTQLIPGCQFDLARIRWTVTRVSPNTNVFEIKENAKGRCMQMDTSNGDINGIACRGVSVEAWTVQAD
jgi:hypothetical protein